MKRDATHELQSFFKDFRFNLYPICFNSREITCWGKRKPVESIGDVLSDLSCEIIEQVFSVLLKDEQDNSTMTQKQRYESEKVLQQILDTFRKYMPWSVSFFGNERLLPLVDYMTSLMKEREQEVYITYPITPQLVQQYQTLTEQIREGNMQSVEKAFQTLIQIVDLGVTSLVREPKNV